MDKKWNLQFNCNFADLAGNNALNDNNVSSSFFDKHLDSVSESMQNSDYIPCINVSGFQPIATPPNSEETVFQTVNCGSTFEFLPSTSTHNSVPVLKVHKGFKVPTAAENISPIQLVESKNNPLPQKTKRIAQTPIKKPNKRARLTQPKTPECLKRNMAKKVVKSSEERELEKIAILRKKVANRLRQNRLNMQKFKRPNKA